MLAGKAAPIDPDLLGSPTTLARIAPTEIDSIFRNTHIHGEVHDENAYAIGGVAGHAGLFGSARDIASFAQLLLNGGTLGGTRLLRPETVEYFTTRQPGRTSRAIGWDTPSGRSSAGDYFSARSFGHTGFTGTSIWIDPERDLFVVLLTNRVNPTRANQRHIALRRAVHDAAQQAIIDTPITAR
jgi:CubicO group peptidase (beta-lactamase class C family)